VSALSYTGIAGHPTGEKSKGNYQRERLWFCH
jgi:hypothetical protein